MNFILLLGFVTLFADIAIQGAFSVFGPYLATLGASATMVGLVAGLGGFIGHALRASFDWIATRRGQYWPIIFAGYGLNLLAVPLLALSVSWPPAATLMVIERFGNALRTPARDRLLSGAVSQTGPGSGFGLHEAMNHVGPILGPLFFSLLLYLQLGFREGFAWLAIPAALAFLCLIGARLNFPSKRAEMRPPAVQKAGPFGHKVRLWLYTFFIACTLAGFAGFTLVSYHFRTINLVPDVQIPIFFAIAMGVEGIVALLAGRLYNHFGMVVLLCAPLLSIPIPFLAFSGSYELAILGIILWGAAMGVLEITLQAAGTDLAEIAGQGIGSRHFHLSCGLAMLAGNILLGIIYSRAAGALPYCVISLELLALAFLVPLLLLQSGWLPSSR